MTSSTRGTKHQLQVDNAVLEELINLYADDAILDLKYLSVSISVFRTMVFSLPL